MAAFLHAASLGYRYLETDVHLTADGEVVAFHDESLERLTDGSGRIADLGWEEVAEARVGGTHPVPRLVDLLEALPEARVNIDPKHDAVVEPLARILQEMGALERVCVGAFSDRRLLRCREILGPGLCTSAGPRATALFRMASLARSFRAPDWRCLQVPVRTAGVRLVDRRSVAFAHRQGLQVHVWTVNDPREMHNLLDIGVDGIMTDRPALLRDVLTERGQWA